MIIHVVNPGDTIYMISKQYGVEENKIIHDNQLSDPNKIIPNQTLIISNDEKQHRVKFGETLHSIAITYNVSIEDLMKENPQIKDPNKIEAESIITIPTSQKKQITVNGYAYPTENLFGVMNALSSLSSLSVFGYQVGADGSLSNIQDSRIIQVAEMAGVIPRMVITNISDNGSFDSNIAHEILNSEQIQNTLLDNILQVMKQKDYKGLNIDFEFVYPADKEKYNNFLKKAADRLHENGYLLYTSLPPKISGDQSGLLYEAQDYPTQGKIADKVILMTYDGYGPPSPIAPIRFIKSVLDYAVTVIPKEKILMGIPNFGADWTMPYKPGDKAKILSNNQALELARKVGSEIQYDIPSQAPYFYYYEPNGKQHVVWFEDARSSKAKQDIVSQYGLGGISYWTVNNPFQQNWLIQSNQFSPIREE